MSVTCRFDEDKYALKTYNDCYGGGPPSLNKEAKEYYKSLVGSDSERLLLTLEKYGRRAVKNIYSKYGVCLCPKECSDFFDVTEYDGLERPYIDNFKFRDHLIKEHFINHETMDKYEYDIITLKSFNVKLTFIYE